MLRGTGRELIPFDPEPERTLRKRLREQRESRPDTPKVDLPAQIRMAERNKVGDYALPNTQGYLSAIRAPELGKNSVRCATPDDPYDANHILVLRFAGGRS